MITFFLLAACMVIVVLALLLPTLTKSHQSADRRELNIAIARSLLAELTQKQSDGELGEHEFSREKQRLERDLADALSASEDRTSEKSGNWVLWPLAAFVPVVAGFVYLVVGTPAAIDPENRVAASLPAVQQQPAAPDLQEVVAQISQRLEQQPDDSTGWFMLGRAYMNLREFDKAEQALRRAHELTGQNPEIIVRLADAIAMKQNGSMAGEPEPLLLQALSLQPQNPQALWLLGIAQREREDYDAAIATWGQLQGLLDNDPASQQQIAQLIAGAQAAKAGTAAVNAEGPPDQPAEESVSGALTVEVALDSGLGVDLKADDIVFIYAKAQQGPPMPLAVQRVTVADLPLSVALSDEDAMMPAMKISAFNELIIGARVSRSGDAIAQPGDLFSEVGGVNREQTGPVRVVISEIVE